MSALAHNQPAHRPIGGRTDEALAEVLEGAFDSLGVTLERALSPTDEAGRRFNADK